MYLYNIILYSYTVVRIIMFCTVIFAICLPASLLLPSFSPRPALSLSLTHSMEEFNLDDHDIVN